MRSGGTPLRIAAALAVLLASAGAAAASSLQVEAVGAVAADTPSPRRAALEAGVGEAVLNVAARVAREAGATSNDPAVLRNALGRDLMPYALRYELLEDRGERPAQLVAEPGVEREYVVMVRAEVDEGRILERLRGAGLLGNAAPTATHSLDVVFEGVDAWPTWERLRRALAARGGGVEPREFARGRLVARLETDESNDALVARLQRAVGSELGLGVEAAEPGLLRIRVVQTGGPEPAAPAAGNAPPPGPASEPPI